MACISAMANVPTLGCCRPTLSSPRGFANIRAREGGFSLISISPAVPNLSLPGPPSSIRFRRTTSQQQPLICLAPQYHFPPAATQKIRPILGCNAVDCHPSSPDRPGPPPPVNSPFRSPFHFDCLQIDSSQNSLLILFPCSNFGKRCPNWAQTRKCTLLAPQAA